jgi:hypothetical protein
MVYMKTGYTWKNTNFYNMSGKLKIILVFATKKQIVLVLSKLLLLKT